MIFHAFDSGYKNASLNFMCLEDKKNKVFVQK